MCRGFAVPELAAQFSGIQSAQMWVCDLVMSRFFRKEGEQYVSGVIQKIQTADL